MGEVDLTRDMSELERTVAIKLLLFEVASDPLEAMSLNRPSELMTLTFEPD
jgi:hypothetical protein